MWGRRLVSAPLKSVQGWSEADLERVSTIPALDLASFTALIVKRFLYDARALFGTISFISYPAIFVANR